MNRNDLVSKVSDKTSASSSVVNTIIDKAIEAMVNEVISGNKVKLTSFGTFLPIEKKQRLIIHPVQKKVINVPNKKTIKFKPSEVWLKELNEKSKL